MEAGQECVYSRNGVRTPECILCITLVPCGVTSMTQICHLNLALFANIQVYISSLLCIFLDRTWPKMYLHQPPLPSQFMVPKDCLCPNGWTQFTEVNCFSEFFSSLEIHSITMAWGKAIRTICIAAKWSFSGLYLGYTCLWSFKNIKTHLFTSKNE